MDVRRVGRSVVAQFYGQVAKLVLLLFLSGAAGFPALGQATKGTTSVAPIDIQADRQLVTRVAKDWRFNGGDDPRWAEPDFNDSSWKVLQPTEDWGLQGFVAENNLAWLRFRLKVPADSTSLVLLMPGVGKAYQIYADGNLVGQVGKLPPDIPEVAVAAQRVFTLPVSKAKQLSNSDSKQLSVAIRVWQDPRLIRVVQNQLYGSVLIGGPKPIQTIFSLSKARDLLVRGNDYTQDVLSLVVGASSLLLFWLTRRGFYAWFSLNMLLATMTLPLGLVSQHFGWPFFAAIYSYAALDFLTPLTFLIFVLGALNLPKWKLITLLGSLAFLAELGPILFILGVIPQTAADGIYLGFSTLPDLILIVFLARAWGGGSIYAKLLLFPYSLSVLIAVTGNLAHFLLDLNVPHASALLTADISLIKEPFLVSLNDVGNALSTLGLLAALVYEFARANREEQRLKSALQTAHDIQQSLVPIDIPQMGGLRTEIVYLAAEEVGGDFCQVLPRADDSILIVIGDVSGKGLQAAMLGTLAVGALRSMADEAIGPAETLKRMNNVLLRTPNRGFITCLCIVLSPSGKVILANAGHLSPYLDGTELMTEPGLPLGIVADINYEQTSFILPDKARLTLMSDGVVEARSSTGELYGFERTSKISRLPAKDIAAKANSFGQEDDITVITLDWQMQAMVMA